MGKISPMALSKKLNVRPQAVYGLIRRGQIPLVNDRPKLVDEEAATKALQASQSGVNRKVKQKQHLPVKVGDVITWQTKNKRRAATVEEIRESLTFSRRTDGRKIFWLNKNLATDVKAGIIRVEHPVKLLGFVTEMFRQYQRPDLASSLETWLRNNEEPLSMFKSKLLEEINGQEQNEDDKQESDQEDEDGSDS